ncbi:MAG: ABC transporter substrate-binding protein [Planctomycetes bacterium]|nr:ABC transporter substrate-binding protein [Planctomycetota bacterium]
MRTIAKLPYLRLALVALVLGCVIGQDKPSPTPAPTRIIATSPSNTEIICALGACDRLVAVSSYATYPPEIQGVQRIGGLLDPDMESILALSPDLLVMRGVSTQIQNLCRDHSIRFYQDRTDTLETMYKTIRELGELLHLQTEASALILKTRDQLRQIQKSVKARRRPRVLLTLRSPDKLSSITTVSDKSYLGEVIKLAGGDNVFGNLNAAYPSITLEDIVAQQPDLIIEAMPGEKNPKKLRENAIGLWRGVAGIQAGQRGNVIVLTEDYVLIPSPRVVQLATRLQRIFDSAGDQRDER